MTTTLRATAIILALLALGGCNRSGSRLLPKELEGIWTTTDPRYQNRFLELSQAFVIIVRGPHDAPSVQLIDKVEKKPLGQATELTVYSTDYSRGEHYQLAFTYSPAGGGEITFRNQKLVWKRHSDSTK